MACIAATPRLRLREFTLDDASFILGLVNEPSFLRYIGDRGVRTLQDACTYIEKGPLASYRQFGFGLWLVEYKDTGEPLGMCGLLKRPTLPDADIGFAFMPEHWGKGIAAEAARATVNIGRDRFGLRRIAAITNCDNDASINLLGRLGFVFEREALLDERLTKFFLLEVPAP